MTRSKHHIDSIVRDFVRTRARALVAPSPFSTMSSTASPDIGAVDDILRANPPDGSSDKGCRVSDAEVDARAPLCNSFSRAVGANEMTGR
jgi:hypothetical protein